jgi:hypothetical protein
MPQHLSGAAFLRFSDLPAIGRGAVSPGFSSSSLKQLWIGHVFFRFGTSRLQELVEAEEFAAEGGGVGGPFVVAGGGGQSDADGG